MALSPGSGMAEALSAALFEPGAQKSTPKAAVFVGAVASIGFWEVSTLMARRLNSAEP